ncbi:hypothetical protein [Promicromonospora soli]
MSPRLTSTPGRGVLVRRIVVAAVVIAGIIAFAVVRWGGDRATTINSASTRASGSSPPSASAPATPPRSPTTGPAFKAEALAREVAGVVLTWDTVNGPDLTTVRGELLALADPTGEETPGLLTDLDAYLPTSNSWRYLESLGARQQVNLDHVKAPAEWTSSVAGRPDLAETYAVNVEGTRQREATTAGLTDRTSRPVRFTVFVRCPDDQPCALLRLGRLGETWEG